MRSLRSFAIGALVVAAMVFATGAYYATSNYMASGSDWEIGGILNIASGGAFEVGGVDITAALSNVPTAVSPGYKLARGTVAVTGSADVTTGLATVVSCTANLLQDASTGGNQVTISIPTQSGGTAGHVTIKVWKPTATNDVTPIAATVAVNVVWFCVGT